MSASAQTWSEWRPRTLTDQHNDITTNRTAPEVVGLSQAGLIQPHPGTLEAAIESGNSRRHIRLAVNALPVPNWLGQSAQDGVKLLALPFGWDQQSASPITATAIQAALEAMCHFMTDASPLPQWTPTRTGGVQLDWHQAGIDLEIEFSPSRPNGYAVFFDHQERFPEWDGLITQNSAVLGRIFRELFG